MEITPEEYEAILTRATDAEYKYEKLVKDVEAFFLNSEMKIETNPAEFFKEYVYVKLDMEKLQGRLKGYFEHLVKTRARQF